MPESIFCGTSGTKPTLLSVIPAEPPTAKSVRYSPTCANALKGKKAKRGKSKKLRILKNKRCCILVSTLLYLYIAMKLRLIMRVIVSFFIFYI